MAGVDQAGEARLTLRAKGVIVLSLPVAVFLAGLVWISFAAAEARDAGQAVFRAAELRVEAVQLEALALDPKSPEPAIERSLARLEQMAGAGHIAPVRAALAQRSRTQPDVEPDQWRAAVGAVRLSLAPILRQQDVNLLQAGSRRAAADRRLSGGLVILGIAGPLSALLLHLFIAGRLQRRVAAVEENARRLAHGLPLQTAPPSPDEIGALEQRIAEAAVLLQAHNRELVESERRCRDLFDRAPVAYEQTDCDGNVIRLNEEVCALLKAPRERLLGRRAWTFVIPDQREAFREAMLRRIAEGVESPPFECEYQLEDGARLVVEIRESLMRGPSGEVTGLCRSLFDVTGRKLASVAARKVAQYAMELRNKNEQLAHALEAARGATEAKSRFLATVSHELRTPLNGIIGFAELLFDGKLGPMAAGHREILSDILSSSRHLLQIIGDILDLSKVEAGRMEFHPEFLPIEPLVQEVCDVIRALAERSALRIDCEIPAGFEASVDPARFKQVLYNYLSNAVKFTPPGGFIQVRIVPAETSFRLEVEDNGAGVAPEEVLKLFQDFQQLSNARANGSPGTGLGLSLTRRIVEAQGGSVGVRSAPEKGSVFTATFPIKAV